MDGANEQRTDLQAQPPNSDKVVERSGRMINRPNNPEERIDLDGGQGPHMSPGNDQAVEGMASQMGLELRPMSEDGKPKNGFSHREGTTTAVLVVADSMAGLQQGFSDHLVYNHAADYGISGVPTIEMQNRAAFAVDPNTYEPVSRPGKDSKWAKFILLTSGGR